jgi:hypothetical protein
MRSLFVLVLFTTVAFAEEPIPAEKWQSVDQVMTKEEMASPNAAQIFKDKLKHDNALRRTQALQKRNELAK